MAEITVIARARDEASAVLRGLQGNMKQLFGPSGDVVADWSGKVKAADTALLGLDASTKQVARSAANLAMPIASQLSPAFSGLAWQAVNVVQGMTLVTGALGIAAVGAVGLAAIVGGALYASWNKSREAIEAHNRAMMSADFGRITEEIKKQRGELEKANEELAKRQQFLRAIDPRVSSQLIGPLSPGASVREAEAERDRRIRALSDAALGADEILRGRLASEAVRAEGELPAGVSEATDAAAQAARQRIADLR